MRPVVVVKRDGLGGRGRHLFQVDEPVVQSILQFQDAVHAFSEGIFVAVADLAHAGANLVLGQTVAVGVGGVLHAVVTMMNETGQRAGTLRQGLVESTQTAFNGERNGQVKADDESRKGIGQEGEVGKAALMRQVGDIAYPKLARAGHRQLRQQVGATPEAGACRPRLAPFGRQQQIMATEQVKKRVTTQRNLSGGQLSAQFGQQFARAHSRMVVANRSNHFQDHGLLARPSQQHRSLLPVGLTADTELLQEVLFTKTMSLPQRVFKAGFEDGGPPFF